MEVSFPSSLVTRAALLAARLLVRQTCDTRKLISWVQPHSLSMEMVRGWLLNDTDMGDFNKLKQIIHSY